MARKKRRSSEKKPRTRVKSSSRIKSTTKRIRARHEVGDAEADRERVRELENELEDLRHELERSERRVEAMKQIGRVLGSNLDLDSLLSEIVSRTTDLLDADRSTLFLVDRGRKELWSKILEGEELREIRMPMGKGIAGWVARHGKPQHIRDVYEDQRFNQEVDRQSGYETRCMLVWPVKRPQSAQVIGVIQVLNKLDGPFNPTDERLLEAIASEIGVGVEVATLYREAVDRSEALERARRELVLLFETERAISESYELREMLNAIVDTAMATLSAKAGAIHTLDEKGRRLEVLTARGTHSASVEKKTFAVGEGLIGGVLSSGEPVCENELEGIKRGRLVVKSVAAVPITSKYSGVIGVFELINKKSMGGFRGDDVRALAAVAQQAGRAITAERRRVEREQSERLTTIGQMLSGVMHDFRTPMTLIAGYSQIMALNNSADDRSQYAHLVHKQIEICSAMIKDLLAFARGERTVLIRKVYVHRFMEEIKESMESEFEGSGVKLKVDVGYQGAARFDETKIRRVFNNIARNAREAMPGGGSFSISVKLVEATDLIFTFQDTGSGVPRELEDTLFEPFATSGKVAGTGLGLAMVKQIAEEHGGEVTYKNRPKRGTTFTFRIPLGVTQDLESSRPKAG